MEFHHIVLLALVQAITEFLPISSSGHLILLHNFFESSSEDAARDRLMDIAVHVGTLLAVLVYFRKDVALMFQGGLDILKTQKLMPTPAARQTVLVTLGSLPIILVGGLVYVLVDEEFFYNSDIIIITTVIFGVLLGIADYIGKKTRTVEEITVKDALLIGCMQCLSIIPGTSRSGITMTAARFLGFSRPEAARFSFLLAIIATAAVGAAGIFDLGNLGDMELVKEAAIAALLSFVGAILVIAFLMKWLAKFSFMPFVVYRLLLGAALITYLYILPALN
jgi:undecaprenyl-diphosphatase